MSEPNKQEPNTRTSRGASSRQYDEDVTLLVGGRVKLLLYGKSSRAPRSTMRTTKKGIIRG